MNDDKAGDFDKLSQLYQAYILQFICKYLNNGKLLKIQNF